MSIARRMQLLLAILITALIVVGATGLMQMKRIHSALEYQTGNLVPSIEAMGLLEKQVLTYRNLVFQHALETEADGKRRIEERMATTRGLIEQGLKSYEAMLSDDEDRRLLEADRGAAAAYFEAAGRAVALSQADRSAELKTQIMGDGAARAGALLGAFESHTRFNERMVDSFASAARATYDGSLMLTVALLAVATLGGSIFGVMTYTRIVGSLKSMSEAAQQIASSLDFTRRVAVEGRDEVAGTGRAFDNLIERVQQSLNVMSSHAGKVSVAGENLATAAKQVSIGSSEQSEAASAMAAAVEELTVSINHVADRATDANRLATGAGGAAHSGAEVIGLTLADIHSIDGAVRQAAERVRQLDADSAKVSAVVAVIRDVADQTNLLALNAAIEAARAGEQGRGFAVVADEVRKLAERTAQSTQEISSTMTAMQSGARNAASGMDEAVGQVERGVVHARQAEESIRQIEEGSARTLEVVAEISEAIREQSIASTSIAQQVERVARMTEENSAAAGSTSETARALTELAQQMRAEVSRYRV